MDPTPESRGRWALLIGIDKYPSFGSAVDLEGCTNDVAIMKDALIRRFNFTEDQITVLINEQAKRDDILAAMEDLVRRAGTDDIVVFHYSGHGSRQKDGPEKDEPDGYDETLVPYDSGRFMAENRDITDDEIYDWLLRLTKRTEYVTLIFDCCHSGTIVRDIFGGKPRLVPVETRPWSELAVSRRDWKPVGLPEGGRESPSGWLPIGQKYVLFAASSSAEAANEIKVGEPRKTTHGALTYYLVQELLDPGLKEATCLEIFERLAPRLSAQFPLQRPQLEGKRDLQIFGTKAIEPMRYVTISKREGERVILDAGAACGMAQGSRWIVHPHGTRSVEQSKPSGTVEILSVGATTSEGKIVDEDVRQPIQAGARAVETIHCLKEARLIVDVTSALVRSNAPDGLHQLTRSKLVWQAGEGEEAHARLYRLKPRVGVRKGDPVPTLEELREESWVAVGKDGEVLGPVVPCSYPDAIRLVVENLESVARLRGLCEIRNTGSSLEGRVGFEVLRLEGSQGVPPLLDKNSEPIFYEGDCVVLDIHNDSGKPLYVYVLDIGLTGKVEQVYPPLGAHEVLEIGNRVQVGIRGGEELKLFMPPDFALLPRNWGRSDQEGRETLKFFATTKPADFRVLFQAGFRFRQAVAKTLDDFLVATFGGGGYGNYRSPEEEWMTVARMFTLKSRQ